MITAWTKHLRTEEDKKKLEGSIRAAGWLLEHQTNILKDMDASLERQEYSPSSYENVNWAFRQAHSNGYRQAIREIIRLNDLTTNQGK